MGRFRMALGSLALWGIARVLLLVGMGLLCMSTQGAGAGIPHGETDPLWQRAAAYLTHHIWVPGEMTVTESVFTMAGELEEERRVVMRLTPHRGDTLQRRLITATENGEEIAAAIRSQLEGPIALSAVLGDSPFAPLEGQRVTHWRTGRQREIEGRTCIGFGYRFTTADAEIEGMAWLERDSGLPLAVTAAVVSVPFEADGATITAYSETNHFVLSDRGECLLKRLHTRMEILVGGAQRRVTTDHRFERHWRWQGLGDG